MFKIGCTERCLVRREWGEWNGIRQTLIVLRFHWFVRSRDSFLGGEIDGGVIASNLYACRQRNCVHKAISYAYSWLYITNIDK